MTGAPDAASREHASTSAEFAGAVRPIATRRATRRAVCCRDLALELLADSEARLIDRVAELAADVAAYRELAQTALRSLHEITLERDRSRDRLRRLLKELHALRDGRRAA